MFVVADELTNLLKYTIADKQTLLQLIKQSQELSGHELEGSFAAVTSVDPLDFSPFA